MNRVPILAVLITAALVCGAVWTVLNSSVFTLRSGQSGPAIEVPAKDVPGGGAKTSVKQGSSSKHLRAGERNRSTSPRVLIDVDSVSVEPPAPPVIGRDTKQFPLSSDIKAGMEGTDIRHKFGPPDAIATASDNGLTELYVYQRKADGKLTTVRLRDGVVQSR